MDPLAEGDVAVGVLPADIKLIGSDEALGVAIGTRQADRDLISGGNTCSGDLEVLCGHTASNEVDRAPVAQRLLTTFLARPGSALSSANCSG